MGGSNYRNCAGVEVGAVPTFLFILVLVKLGVSWSAPYLFPSCVRSVKATWRFLVAIVVCSPFCLVEPRWNSERCTPKLLLSWTRYLMGTGKFLVTLLIFSSKGPAARSSGNTTNFSVSLVVFSWFALVNWSRLGNFPQFFLFCSSYNLILLFSVSNNFMVLYAGWSEYNYCAFGELLWFFYCLLSSFRCPAVNSAYLFNCIQYFSIFNIEFEVNIKCSLWCSWGRLL